MINAGQWPHNFLRSFSNNLKGKFFRLNQLQVPRKIWHLWSSPHLILVFFVESIEDSIGKPLFVAFRALVEMADSDPHRGQLLQLLAELYALQPRVGYYLLYFMNADRQVSFFAKWCFRNFLFIFWTLGSYNTSSPRFDESIGPKWIYIEIYAKK